MCPIVASYAGLRGECRLHCTQRAPALDLVSLSPHLAMSLCNGNSRRVALVPATVQVREGAAHCCFLDFQPLPTRRIHFLNLPQTDQVLIQHATFRLRPGRPEASLRTPNPLLLRRPSGTGFSLGSHTRPLRV